MIIKVNFHSNERRKAKIIRARVQDRGMLPSVAVLQSVVAQTGNVVEA